MLDTCACIYIMRNRPPEVRERFEAEGFDAVAISMITAYELRVGTEKNPHPIKARENLSRFLAPIRILPWDDPAATEAAKIRAVLEKGGQMIGAYDVLIAAHARALKLTVVTNNEREFRRVERLKVENWLGPAAAL